MAPHHARPVTLCLADSDSQRNMVRCLSAGCETWAQTDRVDQILDVQKHHVPVGHGRAAVDKPTCVSILLAVCEQDAVGQLLEVVPGVVIANVRHPRPCKIRDVDQVQTVCLTGGF